MPRPRTRGSGGRSHKPVSPTESGEDATDGNPTEEGDRERVPPSLKPNYFLVTGLVSHRTYSLGTVSPP